MNRKIFLFVLLLSVVTVCTFGQGNLSALRVMGKDLVDENGKKVVLHGVMDTPNRYFNGWRWQTWKPGYGDEDVQPCLDYFGKLFTAMTDHEQGAYATVFRLHLDPCWTNDPNETPTGSGQEDDISRFSSSRLVKYWKSLYSKLMTDAIGHGLYVVMRPPGVCPREIRVGDEYQKYLLTVWGTVTSASLVKDNAGLVSIELANEPVDVKLANGKSSATALRDFFQPIVDKIRANGFTGIIWVPGACWQQHYFDYVQYPINDPLDNIGYAVHCYPGWYGSASGTTDNTNKNVMRSSFESNVPVVKTNPVIVTEIDWSPALPSGEGKYNEWGQWIPDNYGTWGTGTTSGFGNAFRYIHDYYGNVSMVLQGSGLYFDIDEYIKSGKVVPAFTGVDEACGEACFKWYKEFYEAQSTGMDDMPHCSPNASRSTEVYDLNGRRVGSNYHGVCIINADGMARKAIK